MHFEMHGTKISILSRVSVQLKIKSFFSSPLHFTTTHLSSVVNKSLPIEKLRKHVVPFGRSRVLKRTMVDASFDLEGVASDGDDGPPQALASSVVAGGVGAMDTLAVGAQGAAPVRGGSGRYRAAHQADRALGIFERGCIGCGSHLLGERLVARGRLGGQ